MGHGIPNTLGVDQSVVGKRIAELVPGYRPMSEIAIAEHAQHVKHTRGRPKNTLPMLTGRGFRTALAAGLWLVSLVFAHGDMRHVLGTVREVGADRVVVETRDGRTESILTNADTRYFRGDVAAKPDELRAGDRIVVHATPADPPTAKTIRFSTPQQKRNP
jgi:hypothetical protein